MNDWTKKVALVTGASSGIGRATALAFAARGADLVLSGRSSAALEATADEARARGVEVRALAGDLREESFVVHVVGEAKRAFGRLDALVNGAGVGFPGLASQGITDQWREMLETNVLALGLVCREGVGAMGENGGTIVNVSSLAGREAAPGFALYCATKHAVNGFSNALRLELEGTGIRVLVIEPGQTMTSFARHVPHEHLVQLATTLGLQPSEVPDFSGGHAPAAFVDAVLKANPERFLAAEEVAEAIVEAVSSADESLTLVSLRPETRS